MASKEISQKKCVKLLYTYIYIFRPFPVGKSQSVVEQTHVNKHVETGHAPSLPFETDRFSTRQNQATND